MIAAGNATHSPRPKYMGHSSSPSVEVRKAPLRRHHQSMSKSYQGDNDPKVIPLSVQPSSAMLATQSWNVSANPTYPVTRVRYLSGCEPSYHEDGRQDDEHNVCSDDALTLISLQVYTWRYLGSIHGYGHTAAVFVEI